MVFWPVASCAFPLPTSLVIVCDRQIGLINDLQATFLEEVHAHCLTNLVANVRQRFRNYRAVQKVIWDASRTRSLSEFNETIKFIPSVDPKISEHLNKF